MYPAALHKIPAQTVDSWQVLAKCIGQKQPKMMKSITRKWDRKTNEDLEQVCLKKATIRFQSFDRPKQFYLSWYFLCDQESGFERSKLKIECL